MTRIKHCKQEGLNTLMFHSEVSGNCFGMGMVMIMPAEHVVKLAPRCLKSTGMAIIPISGTFGYRIMAN